MPDAITNRLAEMLGGPLEDDGAQMLREMEAAGPAIEDAARAATEDRSEHTDEWCRANAHLCHGRGGTGRLRNFRAMTDEKLMTTLAFVRREGNDPTALAELENEMALREESRQCRANGRSR